MEAGRYGSLWTVWRSGSARMYFLGTQPRLQKYLELCRRKLDSKGMKDSKALFPSIGNGNATGLYSMSNCNRMKRVLDDRTGIEFRIKDLRSTLACDTADFDTKYLNAVSSQLRYGNVKTT